VNEKKRQRQQFFDKEKKLDDFSFFVIAADFLDSIHGWI